MEKEEKKEDIILLADLDDEFSAFAPVSKMENIVVDLSELSVERAFDVESCEPVSNIEDMISSIADDYDNQDFSNDSTELSE